MWSVRVLTGAQKGQIYDLKPGKNVLGRGSECDFKITSVGISKTHCEVHVYKDKMIVLDLKSSNGTFVNGVKVQNAKVALGDKISLFDVIMDVIPKPEIRPTPMPRVKKSRSTPILTPLTDNQNAFQPQHMPVPQPIHMPGGQSGNLALQSPLQVDPGYQFQGHPESQASHPEQQADQNQKADSGLSNMSVQEKLDLVVEKNVMPVVYHLISVIPYKQVFLGFILIYIFMVTLLSLFPLITLSNEANLKEASRRAKSVARAISKLNEQGLLSGNYGGLNVNEALKEDGITDAFIIQHSDGSIVAPTERVGRDANRPFIAQARRELKSTAGMIDAKTLGASHPISIFDPISGETQVKFHSIVYYDVGLLTVDENRVVSLFMQTLIMASIIGLFVYFIFVRLALFPVRRLNDEITQALREKTDQAKIEMDDPLVQNLFNQVNFLLSRSIALSEQNSESADPYAFATQYSQVVAMMSEPSLLLTADGILSAFNSGFSNLAQVTPDQVLNQNVESLPDQSLAQSLRELIQLGTEQPNQVHSKDLHFSQFTCEISARGLLGPTGKATPDFFMVVFRKKSDAETGGA